MDICIIDYGSGNVKSLCNALDFLKAEYTVTDNAKYISDAKKIMFPGVGSFGSVMKSLQKKGLDTAIACAVKNRANYFGICVGMQVLFSSSEESPATPGLGILEGRVAKFTKGKVPQIGWNIAKTQKDTIFLDGYVYFVNSYYVIPKDAGITACTTQYNNCNFCSALKSQNICATQFHPEKSGTLGLEILRRWLNAC